MYIHIFQIHAHISLSACIYWVPTLVAAIGNTIRIPITGFLPLLTHWYSPANIIVNRRLCRVPKHAGTGCIVIEPSGMINQQL